jgi:hypothetical protein
MSESSNLSLPFLAASQAQKHITHNEALLVLDALVQLSAVTRTLSTPPAAPEEGARYLVASPASDDWSGHDDDIAAYQDQAWNFFAPKSGWRLWLADEEKLLIFTAAGWTELGSEVTSTTMLGISTSADELNRLAVASSASLFTHAGAGHQLKLNKAQASDTASFLFQTGYSGRAEAGLAGDDRFHFKVSPDGASWLEAMIIDNSTGIVDFPKGTAAGSSQILGKSLAASPGSDSHNFDPSGWNGDHPDRAVHLALTPEASLRLTGLAGGEACRLALIANATLGSSAEARLILLEHESGDSAAGNRFSFADRMPRLLMPGESMALVYDETTSAWIELLPQRFSHRFEIFSDAFGVSDLTTQVSGTLASGQTGTYLAADVVQKPRGIYQLDTGTTAAGRAHWGSVENCIIPAQGSGLYLTRLAVETLSTSSQRFQIRAGWNDGQNSTDVTDGIYWEYDDSVSAYWTLCTAAAGARFRTVSSLLANTNYVYLGIFLNGDWSRADFLSSSDGKSWSFHQSITAGLPAAAQALGFSAGINKTIGTAQRNLSIDLEAMRYDAMRGS